MGWLKHVEYEERICRNCGEQDTWEFWDVVGRERYVGAVGKLLNQDASRHGRCPHCGSLDGVEVEAEE